jgi:hypothetical protein
MWSAVASHRFHTARLAGPSVRRTYGFLLNLTFPVHQPSQTRDSPRTRPNSVPTASRVSLARVLRSPMSTENQFKTHSALPDPGRIGNLERGRGAIPPPPPQTNPLLLPPPSTFQISASHPWISNRQPGRLESSSSRRKQTAGTNSNRQLLPTFETRLSHAPLAHLAPDLNLRRSNPWRSFPGPRFEISACLPFHYNVPSAQFSGRCFLQKESGPS